MSASFIDTHTHLYLEEFADDANAAAARAKAAGVNRMIFPNVGLDSIEPMKQLHAQNPDSTFMAMGLHPTEITADWEQTIAPIREELFNPAAGYVAVGEIGMDLYWDSTFEQQQMSAFDRQLAWAEQLNLPVIIHCRNAMPQTVEVLEGHRNLRCVFHCFSGSADDISEIRRRIGNHPYFGIGGVVTFKNSNLRQLLPEITASKILLETDSPYLAPVPHRGKRNESSYIPIIAETAAAALEIPTDELARLTSASAANFFTL